MTTLSPRETADLRRFYSEQTGNPAHRMGALWASNVALVLSVWFPRLTVGKALERVTLRRTNDGQWFKRRAREGLERHAVKVAQTFDRNMRATCSWIVPLEPPKVDATPRDRLGRLVLTDEQKAATFGDWEGAARARDWYKEDRARNEFMAGKGFRTEAYDREFRADHGADKDWQDAAHSAADGAGFLGSCRKAYVHAFMNAASLTAAQMGETP